MQGTTRQPVRVPRPLRPGDAVLVIGPGSPCDDGLLESGVALLRSWGLQVEVLGYPSESAAEPLLHLAGNDSDRARHLVEALSRPGVAAVFCTRGGTGCGRTLAAVADSEWAVIRSAQPRWLVGSSDVTAIHQAVASRTGWASLFAPMPATEVLVGDTSDSASVDFLRRILFDPSFDAALQGRTAVSGPAVTAPVVGGTITVIETLLGTPDSASARGRIAFLEDVNEPPRRLDRSLTHLRRAGWFDGVAGIAVGSLQECGSRALDVVLECVADLEVPVLVDLPVGHGPRQQALMLEVPMTLDTDSATLRAPSD